ncbi:alpha/beta hydrolase [Flavobacterium yafengii]|uniref:alpha/beta hydrolase n=1 Tax=Flavobacterium yafengii TaxID=3041253 RepID=UPI0024A8CD44|nr:alpha/beta hydrolase [Flavobacterium yafengii]MDI5887690.1 alpha/beta hydrolase [Flavobacterium yafengii]
MDFQPLHYFFRGTGNPTAKTLLLLHGTGGNERDFLILAEDFGADLNILSLRGNVAENGMSRFFKRLGTGVFDERDLEFRTEEMIFFIKELAVKEGFDSTKIIVLGYSNGANIAGATLILHPDFFAGAILFRPMQPFRYIPNLKNKNNTPLFLSSGKNDPTVNTEETVEYIKILKNAHFRVSHYEMNTSHNLNQDDITLAVEWFKNNYKR